MYLGEDGLDPIREEGSMCFATDRLMKGMLKTLKPLLVAVGNQPDDDDGGTLLLETVVVVAAIAFPPRCLPDSRILNFGEDWSNPIGGGSVGAAGFTEGWTFTSTGTDNLCDCGLGTILDVSPNGSVPSQITPLPGVAALAGNKRRQKDLKDEATQAESINCIAQRLAKMPSPLSSKWIYRMATVAEITNPMEEIDADVPEITGLWEQFDQTGVTNEVMQTSGYTQSHVDIAVNKERGGEALGEIVFKYKSFPTFQNTGHGTMQVFAEQPLDLLTVQAWMHARTNKFLIEAYLQ
ncbi:unnamed protein product [Sphagnum jensenii]